MGDIWAPVNEAIARHLDNIEERCSANHQDVPSWVGSVRAALDASGGTESTEETTDA